MPVRNRTVAVAHVDTFPGKVTSLYPRGKTPDILSTAANELLIQQA